PHGAARAGGNRSGGDDARGAAACVRRGRAGRLRQRARNVHAARRSRGDEGDQGRLRQARVRARGVVDEVGDGPYLRRRRCRRGDDVRSRDPRRRDSTHDQLRASGPRLRPRLRAERGAQGDDRRRALERDGARRAQRLRADRAGRMSFIVEPSVEEYAEEHSTPSLELFDRLAAETREKTTAPQMMVGRIQGHLPPELVRLSRAQRILELGTFTGYSSISMALALPPDGRVISCDVNEETTAIARRYAEEAGVADRIEYRIGPALETIAKLEGPFDLIF